MSGPSFRSGFTQVAVRVVDDPETAASVGLAGFADCLSVLTVKSTSRAEPVHPVGAPSPPTEYGS